jgi:hypothetical protein
MHDAPRSGREHRLWLLSRISASSARFIPERLRPLATGLVTHGLKPCETSEPVLDPCRTAYLRGTKTLLSASCPNPAGGIQGSGAKPVPHG